MKRITVGFVIFLLLIGIVGCTTPAWVKVVRDRFIIQPAESVIGKQEIQRQKVVDAIEDAKSEVRRLQRVEAECKVEASMLSEDLKELEGEVEKEREELSRLADLIEAGKSVTLTNGTVMTVTELEAYAEKKLTEFDRLREKVSIKQKSIDSYTKTAQDAHDRWVEGKKMIGTLEAQLDLLDAKIAALEAVREQPKISKEAGSFEDAIADAERAMKDTMRALDKEREIRGKMAEIQRPEIDELTPREEDLEQRLKDTDDIISELRERADK